MVDMETCVNCGHPIQEGSSFCLNCGKSLEKSQDQEPGSSDLKHVSWENMKEGGFWRSLWDTWRESVFHPNRFFSRLPYKGGLLKPLLFAITILAIGALFDVIFAVSGLSLNRFIAPDYFSFDDSGGIFLIGTQFYAKLQGLIGQVGFIFLLSGICHILLMLFKWRNRSYEASFRAVAYSFGPAAFSIIPILGGLFIPFWMTVLSIIGLKHMQEISGGKAAVVILIPVFVFTCLIIGAFLLILSMFGGGSILDTVKNLLAEY